MLDEKIFNKILNDPKGFKNLEQIMQYRFDLDKIKTNKEQTEKNIQNLFDLLNNKYPGFSDLNYIRDSYKVSELLVQRG